MIIRIVEPKQFIGRIVEERRPLAFPADVTASECAQERPFAVAFAICLLLVVSFGGLVACGLDLVLTSL